MTNSSLAIKVDFTGCRTFHSSTLLLLLIACIGGIYTKFSKFSDDWHLVFEEANSYCLTTIILPQLEQVFMHMGECVQTLASCCD